MLREACVESLIQAEEAAQKGADRIELCSRLDLDGLTPDLALTQQIRSRIKIPIHVMIRKPTDRYPDDFMLSDRAIDEMIDEINLFKSFDIQGFVLGMLDKHRMPDTVKLEKILEHTKGYNVTFHKAIDQSTDIQKALSMLKCCTGLTHVLTSGGATSADQGVKVLSDMMANAFPLRIIAAGGITNDNLHQLHYRLNGLEYHGKRIVGSLSGQ